MTKAMFSRQGWIRFRRMTALALLALGVTILALQGWYLGWVIHFSTSNPTTTAFMDMRRQEGQSIHYRWVAYDDLSDWLKRSVVAAEDAHFVKHSGFDWSALQKAFKENLDANRVVRGGSTISQQLAKNLFLSPRQSIPRKMQEAAITLMIELVMSKRRILELYLNVIEWGDGVFGAAAAAHHYHGMPAGRLDHWRSALLAARIPRPRYYDRHGTTPYLVERAEQIYVWARAVRVP